MATLFTPSGSPRMHLSMDFPAGDGTLAAQVEGLFNVVERLDATMHEMRSRVDQLWGTVYMMMPSW